MTCLAMDFRLILNTTIPVAGASALTQPTGAERSLTVAHGGSRGISVQDVISPGGAIE